MAQNVSEKFTGLGKRYRHVRCLGEGAQGVVHLVEDGFYSDRLVAVKMLQPRTNDEWRTAFKHEFEVLAGLSHPRLSQVHDFGATSSGRVYFTRDYVAGDDLRAATSGISVQALLALFVEICRALKPLHGRGLLHGDLKPGNIICSPDGVAHLIDFSFVRASGEDAMRRGTVQYMAPEVIEGRPVDVRADLYSLGTTMFDIISGSPLFEGTVSEIVQGHLGKVRPRLEPDRIRVRGKPSEEIIEGMRSVVGRLVARQPQDRFPDILEVEAALTALAPATVPKDPLPDYPVISESAGLESELGRIRDAVSVRLEEQSNISPLLTIEGELGTGKSSLIKGIKWWAQVGGIAVAESRCSGGGGLLGPVAELITQALDVIEEDKKLSTAGEHLVEQLAHPGKTSMDLNGLMRESTRLLTRIARRRQLIIAVDDVHQASIETLHVLRGLIAGIGAGDPIAVLAAAERSFPWREQLGAGDNVSLPVLSQVQIGPLVESFLGRTEPEIVDRVQAHTGGNPLFVMTLLRDLAASGEGAERLERLGPPRQLEVYWRERLGTLDDKERTFVEAAAVLARPARRTEIARVAGVSKKVAEKTTASLDAGEWLRRDATGWHVATEPLAREVLAATQRETLIEFHRRAIGVEPDEARRLFHAANCGDLQRVRNRGLIVARSLERLGALHAARDLLEAMEGVFTGEREESAVHLDLGRVCLAMGDYAATEDRLAPLTDEADLAVRRQALMLLGRLMSLRGELDPAADYLNKSLELGGDPADDARSFQELANVEYKRGSLENCASFAKAGLDRAPLEHPVRADLLGVLAMAASSDGRHDDALAYANQATGEARTTGDRRTLALAIGNLSWVRQNSGDLKGAVEELESAVRLNREFGDLPRLMRDQRVLGDLKWWLEEWSATLVHYEEAVRLAHAVANPVLRLVAEIGLGMALAKVGRFERAQLLLSKAERDAAERGQEELRLQAGFHMGDLVAAQGRIGEAIEEHYRKTRHGYEKLGRQAYLADLELELAGWHLWRADTGDVEKARALIDGAQKRKREYEGRGFNERLLLQSGALAIADGRFEEGTAKIEQLTESANLAGTKDLAWQAHLAVARGYLNIGSDFLARRRLRQAEAILEDLSEGFQSAHRTAFWQDVRRNEVRHLLEVITPSSALSSSELTDQRESDIDEEARSLYRVLEFNKQISAEHDLERLLEAILDAAIELTGAERGLLLMASLESGGHRLEVHAARQLGGGEDGDPHERFSRSIAESVHLDGEPIVTVDAMGDERFSEFLSIHELRLRSVACVPVRYRGQGLGTLYLENRLKRGRFGGRDLRVLGAFADQVAIAISQARLLEEAKQRQGELEEARGSLEEAYTRQTEDLDSKTTDLKLARERLERIHRQLEGKGDYHGVIGTGQTMASVFSLVDRVKDLDVPIVLVGESGTGKDLLVRVMHEKGVRKSGPFVVMNCGGVPETLVEATLFGYTRGAFSGATSARKGMLETAHSGTLYLDEIGDMSPRMQVDLLRVLQEGTFTPLGGADTVEVDIRLAASSKVPLEDLVEQGRLRKDLLYRLDVVTIELPPLKDRPEDILPLARHILERETARIGWTPRAFSKDAAQALCAHEWPGNVRELEQTIRRMLVISEDSGVIRAEELFASGGASRKTSASVRKKSRASLESDEESRILAALERCQWNRTKAAKDLGIPRRTFYRKIDKMGLVKKR